MKNSLRFALLVVLALALPLRAAGAVTASFCAEAGHAGAAASEQRVHPHHDAGAHPHEERGGSLGHDCGFCAKHCGNACFALATDAPRPALEAASEPPRSGARPFAAFVPDRPERPPLAL